MFKNKSFIPWLIAAFAVIAAIVTPMVTLDKYSHLAPGMLDQVADTLGEVLHY